MKDFFKSLGKAILYFFVYFGTQIVVSMGFGMVLSISLNMQMMADGSELDTAALTEQLTNLIMENALTMSLLSGIIALLILWVVFLIRKKKFTVETSIRSIPAIGIIPIVVIGFSFNVLISIIFSYIPFPESWIESYATNSAVFGEGSVVVAWIATVIIAPIVEEVFFRGMVYSRLKKGMPVAVATILTSLTFAAVHGTLIWGIYTFVFSLLLIWVFEKYQSLTANIVLHMAFNLAGMALTAIALNSTAEVVILLIVSAVAFIGCMVWNNKITENSRIIENNTNSNEKACA